MLVLCLSHRKHATPTPTPQRGAGLARLVSEAQSREAPVQRLADAVAGRFCYGA
jgi:Cu2+-exporting ATPase